MVFRDLRKLSRLFKDQLIYPLIAAAREGKAWMLYYNWTPDWQYGDMPPSGHWRYCGKNVSMGPKSIFPPIRLECKNKTVERMTFDLDSKSR